MGFVLLGGREPVTLTMRRMLYGGEYPDGLVMKVDDCVHVTLFQCIIRVRTYEYDPSCSQFTCACAVRSRLRSVEVI